MYGEDVEQEFTELLNEGLEEVMRAEAKDELIRNWKTAKIFPVIGMVKEVYDKPVVIGAFLVGIPKDDEHTSMIMSAVADEILPDEITTWTKNAIQMENGYYENTAECLLGLRRAVIALNKDIQYARENGWEQLIDEIMSGNRSTNHPRLMMGGAEMVYEKVEGLDFLANLIDKITEIEGWRASFNISPTLEIKESPEEGGFNETFQEDWE